VWSVVLLCVVLFVCCVCVDLRSSVQVAGAWGLDSAMRWPDWLRQACAALGLGTHPIVALMLILLILGACIAAAIPLTECSLVR